VPCRPARSGQREPGGRDYSLHSFHMQGVIKTFDPVTGAGIIVRDEDRSEVFVRPGSLDGSLFRTLRQGQRVIFDTDEVDGRFFARDLRFGMDGR